MCEVLSSGGAAHESNGRATIEDDDNDFWFGFEQEYFLWNPATNKPIGFPEGGFPTTGSLLLFSRCIKCLWPCNGRGAS